MGGWRRIPLTLLGLLTLLTGGAAVWGQLAGPNGAALGVQNMVQNAVAATYGDPPGSTSFTLDLVSAVSSGGTKGFIGSTRRVVYDSTGTMVVYLTKPTPGGPHQQSQAKTHEALREYAAVTGGPIRWMRSGTAFTRTESFASFSARVTPGETVATGTVHETVVVRDGYLVLVKLRVVVPSQTLRDGTVAAGGVVKQTYQLVRIDGQPAP